MLSLVTGWPPWVTKCLMTSRLLSRTLQSSSEIVMGAWCSSVMRRDTNLVIKGGYCWIMMTSWKDDQHWGHIRQSWTWWTLSSPSWSWSSSPATSCYTDWHHQRWGCSSWEGILNHKWTSVEIYLTSSWLYLPSLHQPWLTEVKQVLTMSLMTDDRESGRYHPPTSVAQFQESPTKASFDEGY